LLRERSARSREGVGSLRAALTEHVLSEVPAVVYTCDPRAPYPTTFITDNVLDEFGYSGAAVLADAEFWMDRIEPADCDMVREGLANLGESPVSLEYRFRCGDGTLRWLRDTVKLVRGASGEPEEIVGCAVDITDRKEVEERLAGAQAELDERVKELTEVNERLRREIMERKGTEARLRSITDNAPSYIIQVSRDGQPHARLSLARRGRRVERLRLAAAAVSRARASGAAPGVRDRGAHDL
jgi:PAS domain S-box-containing protein